MELEQQKTFQFQIAIAEMASSSKEERKVYGMKLYIPLGESSSSFNLESAVCNHGFFMMAPNVWIPSTKTLQRPLRLADSFTSIQTSISHPDNEDSIHVHLHDTECISPKDRLVLQAQVTRMLRISSKDEMDVKHFHQIHSEAKNKCFGRIFRSPSIFEDMVKSILLCNCSWGRSLDMAQALCKLQFVIKGLRRGRQEMSHTTLRKEKISMDEVECLGNFPNSTELTVLDEETLRERCNLGYRAKRILELAKSFENVEVKLKKFEKAVDTRGIKKVCEILDKKRGFGPFACANVLMCMGYYERIPTDSETLRHVKEMHGKGKAPRKVVTKKDLEEIYRKYAPFQCLAYWFELREYYETKLGKLSQLPNSEYHNVSGSRLK